MKYLVSSTVATLCVFGATGVYFVGDSQAEEESQTTVEVEQAINTKMAEATESIFLPYLGCDIEPDEEDLTDEKIESHIADCLQKTHSWQPVQSYAN